MYSKRISNLVQPIKRRVVTLVYILANLLF